MTLIRPELARAFPVLAGDVSPAFPPQLLFYHRMSEAASSYSHLNPESVRAAVHTFRDHYSESHPRDAHYELVFSLLPPVVRGVECSFRADHLSGDEIDVHTEDERMYGVGKLVLEAFRDALPSPMARGKITTSQARKGLLEFLLGPQPRTGYGPIITGAYEALQRQGWLYGPQQQFVQCNPYRILSSSLQ